MARSDAMIGVFDDPDVAASALAALRAEGITTARIASPAPYPAVHATGQPGPWRMLGYVAFTGGVTGFSCAAMLELYASRTLDQTVGGKPPVPWTAFGVVMFELTMLFAGIATLTALIVLAAASRRALPAKARALVSADRIVVVVPTGGADDARKAAITRGLAGAVEVVS